MIDPELFKPFAKGADRQKKVETNYAVIYTRVSSKDQEDNYSLEFQKKECLALAKNLGLVVKEEFGGTSESAKTDERKEFSKMFNYLRKPKNQISVVITYAVDRFSRSGSFDALF